MHQRKRLNVDHDETEDIYCADAAARIVVDSLYRHESNTVSLDDSLEQHIGLVIKMAASRVDSSQHTRPVKPVPALTVFDGSSGS